MLVFSRAIFSAVRARRASQRPTRNTPTAALILSPILSSSYSSSGIRFFMRPDGGAHGRIDIILSEP
jgi:hypothetical protein